MDGEITADARNMRIEYNVLQAESMKEYIESLISWRHDDLPPASSLKMCSAMRALSCSGGICMLAIRRIAALSSCILVKHVLQ